MIPDILFALALFGQTQPGAPTPAPPPAATEAARTATASRLLDLSGYERTLDSLFVPLSPVFASSVIGAMSNDERSKETLLAIQSRDNGQDRLIAILSQEFLAALKAQYPRMKAAAAREYAARFTQAELDEMLAYLQSPTGQKAQRLTPDIQRALVRQSQAIGEEAGMGAGRRAVERAAREILEIEDRPNT